MHLLDKYNKILQKARYIYKKQRILSLCLCFQALCSPCILKVTFCKVAQVSQSHSLQCYVPLFPQMAWAPAAPMFATLGRSALSEEIGRSASVRCVRPSSTLSAARTGYPTATNASWGWNLVSTAARSRSSTKACAVSGSIYVKFRGIGVTMESGVSWLKAYVHIRASV